MDLFNNELWESIMRSFGLQGNPPQGDSTKEERIEFVKNGIRTSGILRFNEEGYLIGYQFDSVKSNTSDDLKKRLKEAVEKEDYSLAAEIKKKIDENRSS